MSLSNPHRNERNLRRARGRKRGAKTNLGQRLREALENRAIILLTIGIFTLLLYTFYYVGKGTKLGDWWRELGEQKEQFETTKSFVIEGRALDCDANPVKGLTVVVMNHDYAEPMQTDGTGFFSSTVRLPAKQEEVFIRFADSTHRHVLTAVYPLHQTPLPNDRLMKFPIPENMLNR